MSAQDEIKRIDAALETLEGGQKCAREDCNRPVMQGLGQWDLGRSLCEQHRREHLDRERQYKEEESARKAERERRRIEAEKADHYAMHRFIGKCKACGANTSVLAQLTSWQVAPGRTQWGFVNERGEHLQESRIIQGPTIPCRQCGKMIHPKQVHGVYKADEECGAKCQTAKGPNCECKCKGLNHGKAWGG